ncbi:MAG TPA: hypothetical protein VNQ79_29255 [Blastocatellia bacterium]|nr:hypothetical protein [Blastocatellia bacterium]
MDTIRQQLVDAVVARMQTISVAGGYETDLGARVADWPRRFHEDELPALGVYDLQQQDEKENIGSRRTVHRLPVQIRIFISSDTPARELRRMIGDVERAIGADQRWGGLAVSTWPRQSGYVIPREAFEIAAAAVEVEIEYLTETFNPFQ